MEGGEGSGGVQAQSMHGKGLAVPRHKPSYLIRFPKAKKVLLRSVKFCYDSRVQAIE
jgi:hypothetical protein